MQKGYGMGVLVVLTALGVMLFVTGCVDEHSYSSKDNNSTVQVQTGDMVTVTLGENPSTGFVWNATTSGDLVITGKEYASGNPVGDMMGMVGGGGSRTWHLSVGRDHIQSFSAVLRRPGEPVNRTLSTFEITFSVP